MLGDCFSIIIVGNAFYQAGQCATSINCLMATTKWICLRLLNEDFVCVASPLYMVPLQGWSFKLTGSQKPIEGHGKCSPE